MSQSFVVEVIEAQDVAEGDTIWVPDDGEFVTVGSVSSVGIAGQTFFDERGRGGYRFDDEERLLIRR